MPIHHRPLTRRELLLSGAAAATALHAQTRTTGVVPEPILDIADWSYHWYGVEHVTLARGTVANGMQLYVEHWIPAQIKHPYSVVLIHGGYGQGSDWISTPDHRRGWATLLLEQGYKVYVLDRPGQGRGPYHPFIHGNFDREAPTFEAASRRVASPAGLGAGDWPGTGDVSDPAVAQYLAAQGQPMANNAVTRSVWRSRAALLLDDIGPAFLITHGDGVVFAQLAAAERPKLVKGIAALETTSAETTGAGNVSNIPYLNVPGGPLPMLGRKNRQALQPVLDWMQTFETRATPEAPANPHPNAESTALQLADQGCFWVGVQRKSMPYGTIAQGQMYVQYMLPAQQKHPYPIVMTHGGGGQGLHMMGIGRRPGWVHYFVQAGYAVYWLDRPSYGRSPYHPDALGPSHLPNVPPYEGLLTSTAVFNTAQWPGPGGMNDPLIDQFMACESGNVTDEAFHSDLVWHGGVELLDRIGPAILLDHAFGGFFGWGVADRRPELVKAIVAVEINGNPFAAQLRWGLTASPVAYDPPVTNPSQFVLVDQTPPPDSPRPVVSPYKLQAEPAHKWKNLQRIPIAWVTSEFGGGGSPVANVAFLKQAGCNAQLLRLRDYGIYGNGNLMLLEKNNHEVFGVIRDWLTRAL